MRKVWKIPFIIILFFVLLCLGFVLTMNLPVNEVGIAGDSIHFKSPRFYVYVVKGKPDAQKTNDETGVVEYIYYNQTVFDETGTIQYSFLSGLYQVDVVIPTQSKNTNEKFDNICDYIDKVYQEKEGYYNKGITEENGNLHCENGAEFGATGIRVDIVMDAFEIRITAYYQY